MKIVEEKLEAEEIISALRPQDQEKLLDLKDNIVFFQEKFDFPPLRPDQLKLSGNGIELRRETVDMGYNEGTSYENKCYSRLITKPGDSLLLGPSLVTYLFQSIPATNQFSIPDAIKLETISSESWELSGLYEFKMGKGHGHGTNDKVSGFKTLLAKLREYPHLLPNLLVHALSGVIMPPAKIIIPKDRSISVTFIYPSKGQAPIRPKTDFQLKYDRVPV